MYNHAWYWTVFYMQATQTSISMDRNLLSEFKEAVIKLSVLEPDIKNVHLIPFTKLYNARCNEFVCNVSTLSCTQSKLWMQARDLKTNWKCMQFQKIQFTEINTKRCVGVHVQSCISQGTQCHSFRLPCSNCHKYNSADLYSFFPLAWDLVKSVVLAVE